MHYVEVPSAPPEAQPDRLRTLGRRCGLALFTVIVAAFTIVCSVQICLQVWAPRVVPTSIDCSAGTLKLAEAIALAREASWAQPGERAALERFRSALEPAWALRPALQSICASEPGGLTELRAVDRLRYAEEHAVRYGAVDLAARRQEIQRLIPRLRERVKPGT